MAKFVLPLLVFVCVGFSQGKDSPKVDPKTGLPIVGKNKTREETRVEKLADVLRGAGKKGYISTDVFLSIPWSTNYDDPADVKRLFADPNRRNTALGKALLRKLELGLKRNKLFSSDPDAGVEADLQAYSEIFVEVKGIKKDMGPLGSLFSWRIKILRFVSTWEGEHKIPQPATWEINRGTALGEEKLKSEIDAELDKVFLAYLKLPDVKLNASFKKVIEKANAEELAKKLKAERETSAKNLAAAIKNARAWKDVFDKSAKTNKVLKAEIERLREKGGPKK